MALVVFLRGFNVGGHRTFRPTALARALHPHDVVNVGAAGTFVVRRPGPRAIFQVHLRRHLPVETVVAICSGADLIRLEREHPFAPEHAGPEMVRFVSVLTHGRRLRPAMPMVLPDRGQWLVRILASQGRFIFGVYRRHMRTIGYLGQLDHLFGGKVTTRSWGTMMSVVKILEDHHGA